MASDVVMPRLSDSMEEGTVLKWLVEVGGQVKRGEPLVEIETDKANMTYESDADGVLVEVLAEEGQTLQVGEVIARLGEEGEPSRQSTDDSRQEEDAAPEPSPETSRLSLRPRPEAEAGPKASSVRRGSGSRLRRLPGGWPVSSGSILVLSRGVGPAGGL